MSIIISPRALMMAQYSNPVYYTRLQRVVILPLNDGQALEHDVRIIYHVQWFLEYALR